MTVIEFRIIDPIILNMAAKKKKYQVSMTNVGHPDI